MPHRPCQRVWRGYHVCASPAVAIGEVPNVDIMQRAATREWLEGMIAIDGTLWPIARYLGGNLEDSGIHYQSDRPTYCYRWVDPDDYDKCSWRDYPELPEV
ncbi:MAG: hypothetical protein PHE87_10795 [Victivallaceae bacterium]|nr:hypothetical protein [Victivallaceae bacterium]